MKKLILLSTLILSLTAYSQKIDGPRSRDITRSAGEGVEAKKILIQRNKELRSKDSTISEFLVKDSLRTVSDSLQAGLIKSLEKDNSKLNKKVLNKNSWIKGLLLFGIIEGIVLYLK